MNRTRLIIAGILVGLFALLTPLALLTRQAEKRLFSPQAYKSVLAGSGFYETAPAIVGRLLHDTLAIDQACPENPYWCAEAGILDDAMRACLQESVPAEAYEELVNETRPPTHDERAAARACAETHNVDYDSLDGGLLSRLSTADWESFLQATTPPDVWQAVFENLIDQAFAMMSGNQQQVSLPLTPFQRALSGPAATEAFLQVMESKPSCSPGEALTWERYLLGREERTPNLCRLPLALYPQAKTALQAILQEYADFLPAEFTLFTASDANGLPDQVWGIRFLMQAALALPLLLLAIASLLVVASPRDWLNWWGGAALGAGLVGLLLGNSLLLRLNQIILEISRSAGRERIPPELVNGAVNASLEIAQTISRGLTQASLTMGLLGVALLLAGWFLREKLAGETPRQAA